MINGLPETSTIGMPTAFARATATTSSFLSDTSLRSPHPSAYGVSPTTTIAASAPSTPVPSTELAMPVPEETALRIAWRIVSQVVMGPLAPCQLIV